MVTQRHYRIGEIASRSGLSVETMRYYEKRGLLSPQSRSESGYRLYNSDSLKRIQFIQRSKQLGFSLEEIHELLCLQHQPDTQASAVKDRVEQKIALIERKMLQLEQLKQSLQQANTLCSGEGSITDCPIIHFLSDD